MSTENSHKDAQQLAKERLDKLSGVAQEQGKQAAELAKKGISALAARMGTVALVATVVLWIAWFFLSAFSFSTFGASKSFTFWDFLGLDLSNPVAVVTGTGSHGFFALLGLAAIAAPFATPYLKHPLAQYLNAVPLAYLVLAMLTFRVQGTKDMWEVLSFSFGTYALFIVAIVLALHALKGRQSA